MLARFFHTMEYQRVKRYAKYQHLLSRYVGALYDRAGVVMGQMAGPNEWAAFQRVLSPRYDLVVISRDFFNGIVYRGNPAASKRIVLYHADQHFHVIRNLKGFLSENYLCPGCLQGFKRPGTHK